MNVVRRFNRVALLFISMTLVACTSSEKPEVGFQQLLVEAGMQFTKPPGFEVSATENNPVAHYERAFRHASDLVEIRYIIRPLSRIQIDYQDPHNAAPEPNHLFPLLFESMVNRLSNGSHTYDAEYPQQQAKQLFNAEWASAATFDINPAFSEDYRQALLIAMHKNNNADAYAVYLYNNDVEAKKIIKQVISALAFEE